MQTDPTAAAMNGAAAVAWGPPGHGAIRLRGANGASARTSAFGPVGHGTIRLLGSNDVAMVAAAPPEPVGHGAIHLGRRPNAAVAALFADATTAAKDDIIMVLTNGGR